MNFKDKVVIVTGGANGIGKETAIQLTKGGATVAIFDVNRALFKTVLHELLSLGAGAMAWEVDITNPVSVKQAVKEVHEKFGKIDVLINCAGVLQDNLLECLEEKEWDYVIDVNLKGAYLMSQAVQSYMVEQAAGKIVLISSQAALGAIGRVNYSAAKAGIQGMIRSLAMELGPKGITVNGVAPGFIDTQMSVVSAESAKKRGIADFEKTKQDFIRRNPIRRTGKPADIAHAILFFASEQASYVTGQTLYVTGAP